MDVVKSLLLTDQQLFWKEKHELNIKCRMVKLLLLPAKMSILKPEQMTDIFDDIQGKNVSF